MLLLRRANTHTKRHKPPDTATLPFQQLSAPPYSLPTHQQLLCPPYSLTCMLQCPQYTRSADHPLNRRCCCCCRAAYATVHWSCMGASQGQSVLEPANQPRSWSDQTAHHGTPSTCGEHSCQTLRMVCLREGVVLCERVGCQVVHKLRYPKPPTANPFCPLFLPQFGQLAGLLGALSLVSHVSLVPT